MIEVEYLYFFWDVESTDNRPAKSDIISLGGVLSSYNGSEKKFEQIDTFHCFVDATKKSTPGALAVHHITQEQLAGQPKFHEMIQLLKDFLKKNMKKGQRVVFVAHNGSRFDDLILFCNFVQKGMFFEDFLKEIKCYGFLDSIKFLKSILRSVGNQPINPETERVSYALGNCYTSFCSKDGSKLRNAHDALVDSEALYHVFNAEKVCCNFDQRKLLEFTLDKEKAMNTIRKSCGMFIVEQERENKLNLQPTGELCEGDGDGEKRPRDGDDDCEPPKKRKPSDTKLCLNCMSYKDHSVCDALCPSCRIFVKPGTNCSQCSMFFCEKCSKFLLNKVDHAC